MTRKFVASYSGGKDSMLAIHHALQQGLEPVALITTYNTDKGRSWFHGIPNTVLEQVSDSLGIPVWLIRTDGQHYAHHFEQALTTAKEQGAEICVFGDIDIEEHRAWCRDRCDAVGLEAMFPLWGESRLDLVHAVIQNGFTATITVVDTKRLTRAVLGQTLSTDTLAIIVECGADACGENGEYHTFVSDGPVFKHPVPVCFGEEIVENGYAILTMRTG